MDGRTTWTITVAFPHIGGPAIKHKKHNTDNSLKLSTQSERNVWRCMYIVTTIHLTSRCWTSYTKLSNLLSRKAVRQKSATSWWSVISFMSRYWTPLLNSQTTDLYTDSYRCSHGNNTRHTHLPQHGYVHNVAIQCSITVQQCQHCQVWNWVYIPVLRLLHTVPNSSSYTIWS